MNIVEISAHRSRSFTRTRRQPFRGVSLLLSLWITLPSAVVFSDTGNELCERVESYLRPRLQSAQSATSDEARFASILARPDPGTYFLRYAFGLKRHAKMLLTEEQTTRLLAVLEQHTPTQSRWHDERNAIRCKWNQTMWQYVSAAEDDAPTLRVQLADWMRLRMLWTQQEHLSQYRFARAVWQVLTPEQQTKLIAGEWKTYAKQDTGHTRGDATSKIITRALGKPDDKAAFESAVEAWSKQREPLHAEVNQAENNERRIVFAMDLNSESMAYAENLKATDAYAKLYLAEADAIRNTVQIGYRDPSALCNKAAEDAWLEANERFTAGASELIRIFSNE